MASKMKLLLAVCGILFAISTQSVGQNLEVLVDGISAVRDAYCVGNRLTFVCTISGDTFVWRVNDVSITTIATLDGNRNIPPYDFTATTGRSTMEVVASMALNNSNITCLDASGMNNQTSAVQLFGDPSAPIIESVQWNVSSSSYSIVLDPPEFNAVCVSNYSVGITETRSGQVYNTIFEAVMPIGRQTIIIDDTIVDSLDACSNNYTFRVRANNSNEVDMAEGRNTFNGTFGSSMNITHNSVSISLMVNFVQCPNATSGYIQLNDVKNQFQKFTIGQSDTFIFEELMSSTPFNFVILVMLPSGQTVNIGSVSFMTDPPVTTMSISSPDTTPTDNILGGGISTGVIVAIAVCATFALLLLVLVILGLSYFCCIKRPGRPQDSGIVEEPLDSKQMESNPDDNIPTYQAPDSIKRQPAGPAGDMYTVPANLKKSSKKAKAEQELPTYSVVDKTKNKEDAGLVYADIDVKNPVSHRSKRPPPPPGVTEQDANEPVVYSTVH